MREPAENPQLQDRLDALLAARPKGATVERTPTDEGYVIALVEPNGGDRISGRGASTADAVADLESKLGGAK